MWNVFLNQKTQDLVAGQELIGGGVEVGGVKVGGVKVAGQKKKGGKKRE